jgi:uncharacterized protein YjbJ (UPF0337 family)
MEMGILDKAKEMLGMDDADDLVGDAKANAQDAMGDAKDAGGGMMDKAKDAAGGVADKAKAGVDKAADAADGATGGKFNEHIDKGSDAVKSGIDKVSGN